MVKTTKNKKEYVLIKKYKELLSSLNLFNGIKTQDLELSLNCLKAYIKKYKKSEEILKIGDSPDLVGIVLLGQVHVLKEDINANKILLTTLHAGDIFAETLVCAKIEESPVTVLSNTDVEVLLFPFTHILNTSSDICKFHQHFLINMLKIIAQKNLYLQNRIDLLRIKSVRSKVLSYLNSFSIKFGNTFNVPLNREEMADYLCVERSALSHELMKMKKDGLINYKKNSFTLL